MFRGRSQGQGRFRGSIKTVRLQGLFADGIWQCNCEPRLPADHFQTKNGGKNHGKWFYTCQQAQHKRCNFFLWDDEARPREATAVLNNSRTEPRTPEREKSTRLPNSEPITPYTPSNATRKPASVPTSSSDNTQSTEEELYEWPNSGDDTETVKVIDQISMPPPETPRKYVKIDALSTPGKRRWEEMTWSTPTSDKDDVFTTPSTGLNGRRLFSTAGLPSPADTPTPQRFKDMRPDSSELAIEVLDRLRDLHMDLPVEAVAFLKEICHKQTLKMQGIAKGRDISRIALKAKDVRIAELQSKIAALEAERETNRAVIRHLRRDMELSGAKGDGQT